MAMKLLKKILRVPYRVSVKIAKKITNFDYVFQHNKELMESNEKLKVYEEEHNWGHPKGHYYSPVHSIKDLEYFESTTKRARENFMKTIPGFSDKRMLKEYNAIKKYYKDFDYPEEEDGGCRYYIKNVSLSLMDGISLYSMIRNRKPKRIIEIGSGFSSCLMMDVNERYFNNKIDITFIEPYTYLLKQRMKTGDSSRYKIIEKGVQFVSLDIFKELESGDFLFIDSTHVSKFNSDVNYEIFDILPELEPGVIIHFHDILDGFEYPLHWLEKGWAWNEAYLLRAFLINNKEYEILLMSNYLTNNYPEILKKSYPHRDILNGGSLWIRKK